MNTAPLHHPPPRAEPPVDVPEDYVGPVDLPGTARRVWWTGRVAIGLRYQRPPSPGPMHRSATWIQELLLG